jgi:hypothetical protein
MYLFGMGHNLEKNYEKKFEEAMRSEGWANQFEKMTKKELWIEKEKEIDEWKIFHSQQNDNLEFKAKRAIHKLQVESNAKKIFWLIVGGIIGGSTNIFDL